MLINIKSLPFPFVHLFTHIKIIVIIWVSSSSSNKKSRHSVILLFTTYVIMTPTLGWKHEFPYLSFHIVLAAHGCCSSSATLFFDIPHRNTHHGKILFTQIIHINVVNRRKTKKNFLLYARWLSIVLWSRKLRNQKIMMICFCCFFTFTL